MGSKLQFDHPEQGSKLHAGSHYERLAALAAAGRVAKTGNSYRLIGG